MKTSDIAERILHSKDVKLALSLPVPAKWDENDAYRDAEQPARIGKALVDQVHRHLVNARIGYLFRESMADRDKIKLGKAAKVGAKLEYFSRLDFLIEINHEAWLKLAAEKKVALMDHELCHFGVEDTADGTKFVLIHHDVEEFGSIVKRWGLWKPDLAQFSLVVGEQLDLLREPAKS